MKAYVNTTSPRPGCPCCNVKGLHGYSGRKTPSVKRSLRAGKKAARQAAKRLARID